MSFKREGDDSSQLNTLKRRRVADLLSNFIPEDEAALLSNGRYTCLVCCYRPVFDTVETLTVHRNGKRHLEGLKSFYGKKARLKNEVTKRRHEHYVQSEESSQDPSSSAPLLEQTRKLTHHALLKTTPYNSCHTKTSTKGGKRPQETTRGLGPEESTRGLGPQESTRGLGPQESTRGLGPQESTRGLGPQESTRGLGPQESTRGLGPQESTRGLGPQESTRGLGPQESTRGAGPQESTRGLGPQESTRGLGPEESTRGAGPEESMTAQRRRELEHYLKLKSDGWLQDPSGRWVRDENVEFDSDEEEEPPSLAGPPADPRQGHT